LWLSFRWAVIEEFEGRMLRLFRRGQNEELTVVNDLRAIGMNIRTGLKQMSFGSHIAGSPDAIINSGVPESPRDKYILEVKTHNKASFHSLSKLGVEKSKPSHYIQMQVYMRGARLNTALYYAVCKDNDEVYTEIVPYVQAIAESAIKRGQEIALRDTIPPKISENPSWYLCKLCASHDLCHGTKLTKQVNCRTCAHATAKDDNTWRCERHDADNIPVEFQRKGCASHVLHPHLVPWEQGNSDTEWQAVFMVDGKAVKNGKANNTDVYSSHELVANAKACAEPDKLMTDLRKEFGTRITG
jgi:hypothetical protein